MRRDRIAFEVGANNFAIEMLKHFDLAHLAPLVTTYETGDVNYIIDVTAGGRDAIVATDQDYLEKYICNNLSFEQEDTDEKIFDAEQFRVDGIDWGYLDEIKLEVHFF